MINIWTKQEKEHSVLYAKYALHIKCKMVHQLTATCTLKVTKYKNINFEHSTFNPQDCAKISFFTRNNTGITVPYNPR